jgi:hypothetical protein
MLTRFHPNHFSFHMSAFPLIIHPFGASALTVARPLGMRVILGHSFVLFNMVSSFRPHAGARSHVTRIPAEQVTLQLKRCTHKHNVVVEAAQIMSCFLFAFCFICASALSMNDAYWHKVAGAPFRYLIALLVPFCETMTRADIAVPP